MNEYFAQLEINGPPRIHCCEPEWRWRVDMMPDHDLWCVLNGAGDIEIDGRKRYRIGPGSCWLFEPGTCCRATQDPTNRLRVFAVHFDPLDAKGQVRRLLDSERPALPAQVQDLALLEAMGRGCVKSSRHGGSLGAAQMQLYLRQLLHLLLEASRFRFAGEEDMRVVRVHQSILEEPGSAWSVGDMALAAHLSRSQFTRLFKSATGRAPMQCVLEARIDRARHLLRETHLRVGEIADMLGYSDIYYFSRQFREMTGHTPSDYRSGP